MQDPQLLSLEFKPWGGNSHIALAATEKHQQRSLEYIILVGFVRESVILMTSRFTEFSISVRKVFLVARRIVANENYCLFFPDKDREKYAILECDGEK